MVVLSMASVSVCLSFLSLSSPLFLSSSYPFLQVQPDKYTQQVLVCTPGSIANEVMAVKRRRLDPREIKVFMHMCT